MKASQAPSQRPEVRQNDFPTAAEVAQGMCTQTKGKDAVSRCPPGTTSARVAKANDMMEAAVIAAANKQARIEEADTFRGVHLDPNAHHWDEVCSSDLLVCFLHLLSRG
jgi:serine/arginine repetitive matrix protein 2